MEKINIFESNDSENLTISPEIKTPEPEIKTEEIFEAPEPPKIEVMPFEINVSQESPLPIRPEIKTEPKTDKVESTKKKPDFLKKTIAVALVAAIAGGSVGLGAGAGSAIMNRFFNAVSPSETISLSAEFSGDYATDIEALVADQFQKLQVEPVLTSITGTAKSVSQVYKEIADAVVSITVSVPTRSYFGGNIQEQSGSGSGVIFDEDSEKVYVITNYHVINGATKVSVSVDDRQSVTANYVGGDEENDIAIISVSKSELAKTGITRPTIAALGDSGAVEIGDSVIAVGNALGNGKIATYGIVSAVGKSVTIDGKEMEFIQTDAAINPGNSGGALVNGDGEVIAINTAKISGASYGIEGIGFSIPSNTVKHIAEQIMDSGYVVRPYIGIETIEITDSLKEMYSLPSYGLYVRGVASGSGAEKAGVQAGDIITAFNGMNILSHTELAEWIAAARIGEIVDITVIRSSWYGTRAQQGIQTEEIVLKVEILDMNAPKF